MTEVNAEGEHGVTAQFSERRTRTVRCIIDVVAAKAYGICRQTYLWALVFLLTAAGTTIAQELLRTVDPVFEVTSVKPSPKDDVPAGISTEPDGSARFTRFQVRTLITIAYRSEGIQRFDQLIGAPSWLSVDRFDVVAKVRAGSDPQNGASQVPSMLRGLLSDRFRLRVHSETRDMPAYALVLARRDGRLGPEFRESTTDCPAVDTNPDPDRWCGIRAAGGVIIGRRVSTTELAGNLSGYSTLDRFVTDRTGLNGRYDFRLEYSPAIVQPGDVATLAGPSLFTALSEQLGLRLEPETKTVPVLVIDRVDKPMPD